MKRSAWLTFLFFSSTLVGFIAGAWLMYVIGVIYFFVYFVPNEYWQ